MCSRQTFPLDGQNPPATKRRTNTRVVYFLQVFACLECRMTGLIQGQLLWFF
jgi:hypothetical protein